MTPGASKRTKASSRGLLSNHRYLCKRAMMLRAMESARVGKRRQQKMAATDAKRKRTDGPLDSDRLLPKDKSCGKRCQSTLNSERGRADEPKSGPSASAPKPAERHVPAAAPGDSWEVDSGFCSESSPPASGRSSPCPGPCQTSVVALDCEMVGTGPGGRCSELARCSILDYHGNVLYDRYVRPCQPVTDFRTRWSGIRRHHLHNAAPFAQAREEILSILEGKVVVGHSIYNDFEALDIMHPSHMVRDTAAAPLLRRLAGFPPERCASLKVLAKRLLANRIQVGRRGHCSVEDARASLGLYKLVEGEWEQEVQRMLRDDDAPHEPSFAASNHYMKDEYWPDELTAAGQSKEGDSDHMVTS